MNATAQFPSQVWDGSSPSRVLPSVTTKSEIANQLAERKPDSDDWDQVRAEVAAIETEMLGHGSTSIALTNSWTNKGAGYPIAGYRKSVNGTVSLIGGILPGTVTAGTTLFTLPSGYRPTNTVTIPVSPSGSDTLASTDAPRITILSTGAVNVYGVTGAQSLDLSAVRFNINN